MKSERGAAMLVIAIAIAAVCVVGAIYLIVKSFSAPYQSLATNIAATDAQSGSAPSQSAPGAPVRYTGSLITIPPSLDELRRVDENVTKDLNDVYIQVGGQTYRISTPDPDSLVRLYEDPKASAIMPGATAAPKKSSTNQSGQSSTPQLIFYKDSQNIYVLDTIPVVDKTSPDATVEVPTFIVITGADPATFQLLSSEYAKDAYHVYQIITTCLQGVCNETLQIMTGADLATFQAFEASLVQQQNNTILIDAADANNLYYGGDIVGSVAGVDLSKRKRYGTPEQNGLIWLAP